MVKPKVAAPGAAVEWRTLGGAAGSGLRWVEGLRRRWCVAVSSRQLHQVGDDSERDDKPLSELGINLALFAKSHAKIMK